MMRCPDCGADLDKVPPDEPCPKCGSPRRDATVTPSTVAAAASVGDDGIGVVSCGQCGQKLDEPPDTPVAERQPCPNCRSMARNIAVRLSGRSTATASVTAALTVAKGNVASAVDAVIARPELQELIATREITVLFHQPHEDAPGWYVEMMSEGEVLASAYAEEIDDACMFAALEMLRAIKEDEGD